MYLEKVIIKGFKSISERTVIDFVDGINEVMGPNGSGKSNVFEAIQWALGKQGAKEFRSSKMEDVIFDGGKKAKPAECAEVTLVFSNKDRYIDMDSDKVSITRKLTRNSGMSYYINGEQVKLRDITTLFMNKGVGKNSYAITSQGKVTEFLMAKPEDIRGIIEEASGISGFKAKKKELINSITEYDRDLERVQAVLSEIERSLKPLKKQVKNAEVYKKLKDELDKKEYFYFLRKSDILKLLIKELKENIDSLENEANGYDKEIEEVNAKLEEYKGSKDESSEKLEALKLEKEELDLEIRELEKDKVLYEGKLEKIDSQKKSIIENINELDNITLMEQTEKQDLFKTISELSASIESKNKELEETEEKLKKAAFEKEEALKNIDILRDEITSKSLEIQNTSKDSEIIKSTITTYSIDLENFNKQKVSNDKDKAGKTSLLKEASLKYDSLSENINKLQALEDKIKSLENTISQYKKNTYKQDKLKASVGLIKNVEGYHGILFDLIKYDSEYETAAESLFGGLLNYFVVENEDAASKCIKVFQKNKIPPSNFIILSKFSTVKKVNDIDGAVNFINIIKTESKYKFIASNYFTNVYVCSDFESGKKIWNDTSQKYKISTLDGQLFNANIIKGGYIEKNINQIKDEYDKNLKLKKDILLQYKDVYEMKEAAMALKNEKLNYEKDIAFLISRGDDILEKINELQASLKNKKDELKYINASVNKLTDEKKAKEKIIDEKNEMISFLSINISNLEEKKQSLLLENSKSETLLEEYEKKYQINKNGSKERIESLRKDLAVLDIQENGVRNSLNERIKDLESRLEYNNGMSNQIKTFESSVREMNDSNEKDLKRINELTNFTSKIRQELVDKKYKYDNADKELNEITQQLERLLENEDEIQMVEFEEPLDTIYKDILSLRKKIESLGFINLDALREYDELNGRYELIISNKKDLETAKEKIMDMLFVMESDMREKYLSCFNFLKTEYEKIFKTLFRGGTADLIIEDEASPLESGVLIKITPPGKKTKAISLLSGGEKSLAAISFIFALLKYNPSPMVVFDEVDAALDDINIERIAEEYIKKNKDVQYIIISHRKPMMKIADVLYGASMNDGITKLVSIKTNEKE